MCVDRPADCEIVTTRSTSNNDIPSQSLLEPTLTTSLLTTPPRRVAIASFEFEGNDFSQKVNGRDLFVPYAIGEAMWREIDDHKLAVTGGAEVLRDTGSFELVPILVAQGGSGAKVDDAFYQETFFKLVEGIRHAGALDGVFLSLHGAMVSGGVTDAEGDLLEAVRGIVGPNVTIAVSLDLHGHVTVRMLAAADIIVGYANYPHDDAYDTGRRTATLLRDTLLGNLQPVMRAQRMNMIVPVTGSCTALPDAPLAKIQRLARSLETGPVVSTSYFTVQPWLDNDDAATVALAITNGNEPVAATAALQIAEEMWSLRREFELPLFSVEEALERAKAAHVKPVVFVDQADAVGAGSGGDGAYVLGELIRCARDTACAVFLVDSEVAKLAHQVGIGGRLTAAIGHREDSRFGTPLPIQAEVVSLHAGEFTYTGGPSSGVTASMGPAAVLKVGLIQILVASIPTYDYAGEQYASVGMRLEDFDIVVFKNPMNFRTVLKPRSMYMLIDGIGSSSANLAQLPWKNRVSAFWPRDRELLTPFKR